MNAPLLNDKLKTYWTYRRRIAFMCLIFGAIYAIGVVVTYAIFEIADFPVVGFSAVLYLFLVLPIVIYMTGANREDLEKIKGIIEAFKQ